MGNLYDCVSDSIPVYVLRRTILTLLITLLAGCAASAETSPTEKAVVTFEEPAYVNMPIWAHIEYPSESLILQANLRYPFTTEPWFCWGHDFEVTRNGAPLPRVNVDKRRFSISGMVGGSCAPASSPKGRLPLHLFYRFDTPGVYAVRYTYSAPDLPASDKVVLTSDWTLLKVKPLVSGQREAWLKKMLANPPKDDAGAMVGDYLPSILACPDEQVLPTFLDALHNPDDLVQKFALNALHYYGDDVRRVEIPKLIKAKGSTELLGYELSWEKRLFEHQGEQIADSVIPFLKSNSTRQVGGALHALRFLRSYDWAKRADKWDEINKAIWDAVPHILTFKDRSALWPLTLFLGEEKSDRSRELLWKLSDDKSIREQTLICLCWIADSRDLPKLGSYLFSDDKEVGYSLPYLLAKSYGSKALPYLRKALKESLNGRAQIFCARELAQKNDLEAFYFYRDALSGKDEGKQQVIQDLRDYVANNQKATEEELAILVEKQILELEK